MLAHKHRDVDIHLFRHRRAFHGAPSQCSRRPACRCRAPRTSAGRSTRRRRWSVLESPGSASAAALPASLRSSASCIQRETQGMTSLSPLTAYSTSTCFPADWFQAKAHFIAIS
jgi:hypothetical protein